MSEKMQQYQDPQVGVYKSSERHSDDNNKQQSDYYMMSVKVTKLKK